MIHCTIPDVGNCYLPSDNALLESVTQSMSYLIPEIRLLKRCKTANLSRVSSRAQVTVLRRDSDSPSYIVLSSRISGKRLDVFRFH